MTPITQGRIKLAEHARNVHVVTVPHGTKFDDCLDPVFWSHVAAGFRFRDRVEMWAEDKSWFAEAVVLDASRLDAKIVVLNKLELGAPVVAETLAIKISKSGYHADYGGGVDLWRVVRDADSRVMTSGLSQAAAEQWIRDHVAANAQHVNHAAPKVPKTPKAPKVADTSPVKETADSRAAIVIPDDWKTIPWSERRALASRLTDQPVRNGADAQVAIEAELKRRTDAAAGEKSPGSSE